MLVTTTMTRQAVPADGEQHARVVDGEVPQLAGVGTQVAGGVPEVIEHDVGEHQVEAVKPTSRCLRASSSWPKARSSTRTRAISSTWASSSTLADQPVSRPSARTAPPPAHRGPEAAVGHPPVGDQEQRQPQRRPGGQPHAAVDRGPAGPRSLSPRWRGGLEGGHVSELVRPVVVLLAIVLARHVRNLTAFWRWPSSGRPDRRGSRGHRPGRSRPACPAVDPAVVAVGGRAAEREPAEAAGEQHRRRAPGHLPWPWSARSGGAAARRQRSRSPPEWPRPWISLASAVVSPAGSQRLPLGSWSSLSVMLRGCWTHLNSPTGLAVSLL